MEFSSNNILRKYYLDVTESIYLDSNNLELCYNTILERSIKIVVINKYRNFHLKTLDFLDEIGKHINGLIIETDELTDISCLEKQNHFETIFVHTDRPYEIDFDNFPLLKHLNIRAGDNVKNIENLTKLQFLAFHQSKRKELQFIKNFIHLKFLKIAYFKKLSNISFISNLRSLKFLELINLTTLSEIEEVENLNELEHIFIMKCKKIQTLNIENLSKLVFCNLNGQILKRLNRE
ncbi:MAG: hypothetical protein K9I84_00550 [Leadbetterella sp.]|nr:hypothetical protein [Leadbetterella sp.]